MRSKPAEKIARTGITRRNDMMYFVKNGDVWAMPRRRPKQPMEPARLIAEAGVEMDFARYLYYVDGDGDIARMERAVPKKKKKKKAAKKKKKKKKKATKKAARKKKKAAKKKAPPRRAARDEPTTSRRL